MVTGILIVLALVLAGGLFAGAEMAITASRRGRLRTLADAGDSAARKALDLAADPDRFLRTMRVGVTLVATLAAAYGGAFMVPSLAASLATTWSGLGGMEGSLALGLFVLSLTSVTLLLGQIVPERLAIRNAEAFARGIAPLITVLATITSPLVWALNITSSAVLFLVGVRGPREPRVSVDDIEHLLETGRAEGVLESVEQAVAVEALRLGERTVRDIMRPRVDIDALDVATPPDEIIGAIAMAGYSRLPVYEGSLDHILGYVSIKDVLRTSWMGWPTDLRKMMRKAVFVPETMPLDRLLELLRRERTPLAIVLDEYGGTDGLVTIDDVLAELVGEIHDDRQAEEPADFVDRADGSCLVEGSAAIGEVTARFGIDLGPEPRDYETVSGLVLSELERLPSAGDVVTWKGLVIEVVDMDGRRIDKLLIRRQE
jgi:putative hemolysin